MSESNIFTYLILEKGFEADYSQTLIDLSIKSLTNELNNFPDLISKKKHKTIGERCHKITSIFRALDLEDLRVRAKEIELESITKSSLDIENLNLFIEDLVALQNRLINDRNDYNKSNP